MIRNGPNEHPGAKYVIREMVRELICGKVSQEVIFHFNWATVERHLLDGDYVIFNRQPSLHKMSMMGHCVKFMPYSTFRLISFLFIFQFGYLFKEPRLFWIQ
jgi:DNA-directed RNA polymerase II subunit RPB1